jgi:hypothetical protein
MRTLLNILLLVASSLSVFVAGCEARPAQRPATAAASSQPAGLTDRPLAAFQVDLLDMAFRVATAIPLDPHIKDRCKAQEAVVVACLELDQPARALGYLEKIADSRRGVAYGDLALYCASHGQAALVPDYLKRAEGIAKTADDWGRDRIRVKIAQTHALLGDLEKASQFEADVDQGERGKVLHIPATQASPAGFDEQMKAFDAAVVSKNFDVIRNQFGTCAVLFDRFYADAQRRSLVESKMKEALKPMPRLLQIDTLLELARMAVGHGDKAKALELVNEAQAVADGANWPLEYKIPLMARLASARFQAGDLAKARADAAEALALFEAQRDKIVDIDRAGALIPLGEAYQAMGDTTAAVSVYKRAVENGVINPNSRPRAEDVSAICRSMALQAIQPDAPLWSRIREVSERLGPPW